MASFKPETDWQLKQKSVSDRCGYLLKSEQWSDCCFIFGNDPNQKRFSAHKMILAMASPVFEAMFFGGTAEHYSIPISDVQPEAFKALLDYIYTDQINIATFDQACEVCYAAKKYMLPCLVEECTQRIFEDLYTQNACKAYEFGKLFEEPILIQRSLQIIYNETEDVLADDSFNDVELSTLLLIFDAEALNISSERVLFNALLRWAKKECCRKGLSDDSGNLRAVTGSAITKIHFLTLTPLQFAQGPAEETLLTKDEALSILVNICNPNSASAKFPMPEGFSMVVEPRARYQLKSHDQQQRGTKLYCIRPILETMPSRYSDPTDCITYFSVDRIVCILGIRMGSQINFRNGMYRGAGTYNEILYAYLLDTEGSRLTYTHLTGRLEYNTELEIMFNRPVYIQRNKTYRVVVAINCEGWYSNPVTDKQPSVSCSSAGHTFTFYYEPHCHEGLVTSLIWNTHGVLNGIVDT